MDTNTNTNTTIKWMPAIPLPAPPFNVQKRIQELRGYMDPNNPWYQAEGQHTNIKAAIKLYEDEKIDGVEEVFIMDGKVVPEKEIWTGKTWSWSERRHHHQFAQKHTYGHGPFGPDAHEVSKEKVFAFIIIIIIYSYCIELKAMANIF
jgi:hypothetical protein